jgi:hypothetical protein
MTPEAQRIAIAEACGWTEVRLNYSQTNVGGFPPCACGSDDCECWSQPVPNYLSDLNAMNNAELRFHGNYAEATDYYCTLEALVSRVKHSGTGLRFQVANASAAQRAEAFLRTLNLWTS